MSKMVSNLYNISRNIRNVASKINDVEVLLSGDPKKIKRRIKNKAKGRVLSKVNKKVMNSGRK